MNYVAIMILNIEKSQEVYTFNCFFFIYLRQE